MIFDTNSTSKSSLSKHFSSLNVKKLDWKDKLKRDLYKQNMKSVRQMYEQKRDPKLDQQKRAATKVLSKLLQQTTSSFVPLSDIPISFAQHGHYSSYIPLKKNQQKLSDQLQNTFPYIQHLVEKGHQQTRTNVYNQISNHLRLLKDKGYKVEDAWKNCIRKYMCSIDVLKAIEVYVQIIRKGTNVLESYHKLYGNGCTKEVFFQRVCQASKYFKPLLKINKNLKTTIQLGQQITQVNLPKTSKYLFCSICCIYDCNHHNTDDMATQHNYQYISSKNIKFESDHVQNILKIIKFQKNMQELAIRKDKLQNSNKIDVQQNIDGEICSQKCYKRFRNQEKTYNQAKNKRRPILSPLHRSLIKMAIEMFSYDPCIIWIVLVQQANSVLSQTVTTCESVYFYFIEEYNILNKLQNRFYDSQTEMLSRESLKITDSSISIPNLTQNQHPHKKPTKNSLKFDHQDNENYRIGICNHYFIGQQAFDHTCSECCCKRRGFCLPECQCSPQCKIMKSGCSCKSEKTQCRTKKCPCFSNHQQCIPELCSGCFESTSNVKKNSCKNTQIQLSLTKHIKVGQSSIMGLGAFAFQDIPKDQLVMIYTGEMIQHSIDYMREGLRFDDTFYNFGLAEGGAIDARFLGNKSRFINHQKGGEENLFSSTVFSGGRFKTVLIAKKNIKKGHELFFDYDVEGTLVTNFPGKYDFIKKKKK